MQQDTLPGSLESGRLFLDLGSGGRSHGWLHLHGHTLLLRLEGATSNHPATRQKRSRGPCPHLGVGAGTAPSAGAGRAVRGASVTWETGLPVCHRWTSACSRNLFFCQCQHSLPQNGAPEIRTQNIRGAWVPGDVWPIAFPPSQSQHSTDPVTVAQGLRPSVCPSGKWSSHTHLIGL